MELGTAKPTPAERALIPHHCLDLYDPTQPCTAGDYARHARATLAALATRNVVPILTGGTGLYARALLDGLFPSPVADPALRTLLRRRAATRGPAHIHRTLTRFDPLAASRIHPNDTPKLIRAIEVSLAARRPITEQWTEGRDALTGYSILRLTLDPPRERVPHDHASAASVIVGAGSTAQAPSHTKWVPQVSPLRPGLDHHESPFEALYPRVNQRAAHMFQAGLLQETEALIARFGPHCRPFQSLGYAQAAAGPRRHPHRTRSHRPHRPGPPQLQQAPDDLVPPRSPASPHPLAPRPRRLPRHPRPGRRPRSATPRTPHLLNLSKMKIVILSEATRSITASRAVEEPALSLPKGPAVALARPLQPTQLDSNSLNSAPQSVQHCSYRTRTTKPAPIQRFTTFTHCFLPTFHQRATSVFHRFPAKGLSWFHVHRRRRPPAARTPDRPARRPQTRRDLLQAPRARRRPGPRLHLRRTGSHQSRQQQLSRPLQPPQARRSRHPRHPRARRRLRRRPHHRRHHAHPHGARRENRRASKTSKPASSSSPASPPTQAPSAPSSARTTSSCPTSSTTPPSSTEPASRAPRSRSSATKT